MEDLLETKTFGLAANLRKHDTTVTFRRHVSEHTQTVINSLIL